MRKYLTVFLCVILICCLVGCGHSEGNTPTNNGNSSGQNPGNTDKQESKEPVYTLADYVIVENDDCKMTVTSCSAKHGGGVELKVLMENKTEDKTLMFAWDDVAVNGWMIDPCFASTVAAGKKANSTISFGKSDFEECNLESADKIEFNLRIYDDDDWMADEIVDDVFSIYPTGLSNDEIVSPNRRTGKDETVIIDNDKCTFVILGTKEDSIWGYTLIVYLENKSDMNLMFSWDDVSVNGFMLDPFWATTVSSGNKKYSTISFSNSGMEENGIEKVVDIEFGLRVYDDDNWNAKKIVDDTFHYSPSST